MELVLTFHYDTAFKQHFSYNEVIQSTALTYDLVVFFSRHEDWAPKQEASAWLFVLKCLQMDARCKWNET